MLINMRQYIHSATKSLQELATILIRQGWLSRVGQVAHKEGVDVTNKSLPIDCLPWVILAVAEPPVRKEEVIMVVTTLLHLIMIQQL